MDPDANDVRHPGDYIEEEMVPYIDRALSGGETVYSQDIVDTTWGPIFTACYPITANLDGTEEIVGAFCIEMDIQMPNMNGYKATQEIRHLSDKDKACIPIIAITANAFEEDKRDATAAGMNGHIAKPIQLDKLLSTLAQVIRQQENC